MIKSIIPPCRICFLSAFAWFKLQLFDKKPVGLSWSVSSGGCTPPLHLGCSYTVQKFCHQTSKNSLPALQLEAANLTSAKHLLVLQVDYLSH